VKEAAGALLYRGSAKALQVLLIHASGRYNRKAPWSIPKGEPEPGESLEATARRETREEAGLTAGELSYLGDMVYRKTRKRVHCFTGPAPEEDPKIGSWEIDQARFVSLVEARRLIHPDQAVFLDRLENHLAGRSASVRNP